MSVVATTTPHSLESVVAVKSALEESTAVFQHQLQRHKALMQEAQKAETTAFKDIQRLQVKMTATMVRLAREEEEEEGRLKQQQPQEEAADREKKKKKIAAANTPSSRPGTGKDEEKKNVEEEDKAAALQRQAAAAAAAMHRANQDLLKAGLLLTQKDYLSAERLWKERTLETAEVRAQIQDLVLERNQDIETFADGGVHHLDNTKPARITEVDIMATYQLPEDTTRPALIQSAYPKVDSRLAQQHSPSPSRGAKPAAPPGSSAGATRGLEVSHDAMPGGLADDELLLTFQAMDKDQSGFLDAEELQSGYFDGRFGPGTELPGCKDFVAKQIQRLPKAKGQPKNTVSFGQFAVLAIKWAAM